MEYHKKPRFPPWLALLGWLMAGCTATPPDPLYADTGVIADTQPVERDLPVGCPSPPTLAAPVVAPPPNPTGYAIQPLRGTAPGAAMVTARGGAGTAAPQVVGADGKFCIEVRLIEDAQNSITLVPLDARGCPGRSTIVSLRHKTAPKPDGGLATLSNVAKQAPIASSIPPKDSGILKNLNDGDTNSWAKFSFWDFDLGSKCDASTWIRVDFGKLYTISKLKIFWAPGVGSDYATCYTLLLSKKDSPADPKPSSPDWIVVGQQSSAPSGTQTVSINPETAKSAALLMYENASTGLSETFKIAEFEVYGQDPNAVPLPPPDSCK